MSHKIYPSSSQSSPRLKTSALVRPHLWGTKPTQLKDTLKCVHDEKCLAQINIDCFGCKSPEHLPHQVAPFVIAPTGRFSFPDDAAQFDVQVVKGSRLTVGDNYLRFWLQLETTATRAPDFIYVHSEPIRFTVPLNIRLVRDHLSARLKETSAGLDQQVCEPKRTLP